MSSHYRTSSKISADSPCLMPIKIGSHTDYAKKVRVTALTFHRAIAGDQRAAPFHHLAAAFTVIPMQPNKAATLACICRIVFRPSALPGLDQRAGRRSSVPGEPVTIDQPPAWPPSATISPGVPIAIANARPAPDTALVFKKSDSIYQSVSNR